MSTLATRNRVSLAAEGGQALLDSLDSFKRRHVVQNKEIIHKNSELMKRLRETQEELMATKGELLRIRGVNFQLEVQIAGLKTALRKEQDRTGGVSTVADAQTVESLRRALDAILVSAQQAQQVLNAVPRVPSPPPVAQPVTQPEPVATAIAAMQPRRDRRATLVSPPDLSHISEGQDDVLTSSPAPSPLRVLAETPPHSVASITTRIAERRQRRRESGLQPPRPVSPLVEPEPEPEVPSSPTPVDEPARTLETTPPEPVKPISWASLGLTVTESPRWPSPSTSKVRARSSLSVPDKNRVAPKDDDEVAAPRSSKVTVRPDRVRAIKESSESEDEPVVIKKAPKRVLADVTSVANRQTAVTPVKEQSSDGEAENGENVGGREGRRSKKSISYAEPSLTAKIRRPEGYQPVTATGKKRKSAVTDRRHSAAV